MKVETVSLFCGGGGETAGKARAFAELGVSAASLAINHWQVAVSTHGRNFPSVVVAQEDIAEVTARDFGLTHIDLLWASPSCVHHSRARGGKPMCDQQRSHADEVLDRWVRVADVRTLLVENVPEFEEWGPLDEDDRPIASRKGEFFRRFVGQLRELGYRVGWRVLCAADYGDPTSRRRFFLQAVKAGPITWPPPTHRDPSQVDMWTADLPSWRSAAECIDWDIPCPSIFDRPKPLADSTLKRVAAGVAKFVLGAGRPFIVTMRGTSDAQCRQTAHSIDEPLRTISSGGIHHGLVTVDYAPSLIQTGYGEREGQAPRVLDIHAPLGTVVACGQKHALVAAFLAKHYTGVTGQSLRAPLGTVTAVDHHSLVTCDLGPEATGRAHQVAAFLTTYYGNGGATSPRAPLPTVTTVDRHALVTVTVDGEPHYIRDIGLRMLQPRELARAMGFPETYAFETLDGAPLTKRDAVKIIGNACPVGTVAALVRCVVERDRAAFGLAA